MPGRYGKSGMVAAYTSVTPQRGCSVKMWPPHVLHHLRLLFGVLWKVPMLSAPRVMRTASGFHNVNALTGLADQLRHDSQWQKPIAAGSPLTVSWTAPQKQLPLYSLASCV